MPWFKVDDDLTFHQKTVKAGNSAMGLWVRAGAWCAQQLTDGFIPDAMIELIGTPAQRRKLIAAGLWLEVAGGCSFHGWGENGRQPTAQSVREKRAAAAKRQQEYRDKLQRDAQAKAARNAVTDTSVTGEVTPVFTGYPTRPVPSTPTEYYPPDADAPEQTELLPPAAETPAKTAHRITHAFATEFRPCNFKAVLAVVKSTLAADWQPDAVHAALFRVGSANKPITLDTMRNELRGGRHLAAVPGGHTPWQNPVDPSVYEEDF